MTDDIVIHPFRIDIPPADVDDLRRRLAATRWPAVALPEDAVGRDDLLTAVSVHWFTASGASAAHGTYEGMRAWRQMPEPHGDGPPRAVAVFAADTTVRAVLDPDGAVGHWSEFDRGGHFPAVQTPDLLVGDIRDFFAAHRC